MKAVPLKSLDELVHAGVIQLTRGKVISKKDIKKYPGQFPVYSSAKEKDGQFGEYGHHMFDEELITWSVDGGGRLFHRAKHKFSVTNVGGVLRIRDRSVIGYRYLYYALTLRHSEVAFDWVKKAHPSIIKRLYQNIPVPPLFEQERIVGVLDEVFERIATAKANAEKNLDNARALFEGHLQSVFTRRDERSVEKKLNEVSAIASTLVDPRKDEFLDLIHVGAGNIEAQTGALLELRTAREENLISGKFLFDDSMVLYSKIRPYLMKVARPDFSGLCSADIYPLAPVPNQIVRDYLFYLLLSKRFTEYAIQGSARAGMPKINREHLFEYVTWLPTIKEQLELAKMLDNLHEATRRLESIYQRKLAALDALKESLLHRAFTGKL